MPAPLRARRPRYIQRVDLAAKAAGEELWPICSTGEDLSFSRTARCQEKTAEAKGWRYLISRRG
jgi:hypothetical protein